ncbi:TPA: hypothetical protein MYU80_001259 [Klebsiella pneumoniae]|uniref:DUF5983 family protein n=1 Tax=Klebsiella pneumoniae TaxID=573 RepID=UPI000C7DA3EA|nr:DUF5983 family protein [Klebsiella pneumoniae]EIX9106414.1 hypothetical protein [Klebsiella pneumoniae]EIY1879765.1 hypothetical protein [Klebsiella pneumoniae]EKJ7635811.1 hypothetical protein [Klebsiella pneumoniae]MCQ0531699.1 DUF5983 family protein [Klebsiella pneumoniae]MCQ0574331.1 DUF5983 family protein [Klebsiella pneumoniae]
MKISLNVEADAISVTALNGGRIAVDMDGVAFTELIAVVNQYDDAEQSVTKNPVSPWARITGICCSIAHITSDDNACLGLIQGSGHDDWIHDTGYGYLLRLNARSFPVLQLKRLGLSKACRRLVTRLMLSHHIDILHLDTDGDLLPHFETFDW